MRWIRSAVHSERTYNAMLVGTFGAGLVLLNTRSDFTRALGEAFVIAVVLAFTVDKVVKQRLAKEVGRDVFFAVLSRRAPEWYVDELVDSLGRGLVADTCNWSLTLTPHGSEFCSLHFRVVHEGRNFSSSHSPWPEHWLPAASADGEPNAFDHFSLTTRSKEGTTEAEVSFDADALAKLCTTSGDRRILNLSDRGVAVPADAPHFSSVLEAHVTLHIVDVFPLVTRFPTRTTNVCVASQDVDYRLQYGLRLIEPQKQKSPSSDTCYVWPPATYGDADAHPLHQNEARSLNPGATIMLRLGMRAARATSQH